MNAVEILDQSYRTFLGEALAGLFVPWLVLVLWRRWLPRWPQTFLAAAITVFLMAPVYGFATYFGGHGHAGVSVFGNVVGFVVIWLLRDRTPARPDEPAKIPDARWKLLLALLGSLATLSLINVLLHIGPSASRSSVSEVPVQEAVPPSYEADFKKALESRDAWAAYAAYREATRYRDNEKLRPVIGLYADLRDPTGMAFKALLAREEGREDERLQFKRDAARAGDPLAKVLVLESERGRHGADDIDATKLSQEARAYSDELFLSREFTEVIMRCLYIPLAKDLNAQPTECSALNAEDFKMTAVIDLQWAGIEIRSAAGESADVPLNPINVFGVFKSVEDTDRETIIRRIPPAASGYGRVLRATQWTAKMVTGRPPSFLLSDLRLGVQLEDPESGILLHEASFIPPFRDSITPEEALAGLRMAANWGHPGAMKRLSSLYEQGVGVSKADPTLALALLLGRDRYKDASDPDAVEDANRIAATLTSKQIETANFSAKTWRPGGLMVLFDPEKWAKPE